jgi:hypothetical protein
VEIGAGFYRGSNAGLGSSGRKKLADFGTSSNIATSVFTSLINRTNKFLVSYCNLSKIRRPFGFLVVSILTSVCVEEGSFGVRAGANLGQFLSTRRAW